MINANIDPAILVKINTEQEKERVAFLHNFLITGWQREFGKYPEFITASEAARIIGKSPSTLSRDFRSGKYKITYKGDRRHALAIDVILSDFELCKAITAKLIRLGNETFKQIRMSYAQAG